MTIRLFHMSFSITSRRDEVFGSLIQKKRHINMINGTQMPGSRVLKIPDYYNSLETRFLQLSVSLVLRYQLFLRYTGQWYKCGELKLQTLEEMENLVLKHSGRCWWCGQELKKGSIWSDDNPHGINLQGYQEKQIIFFCCNSCGRNTSVQSALPNLQYIRSEKNLGLTA